MAIDLVAVLLVLLFRAACLGRCRSSRKPLLQLLAGLWLGLAAWMVGALLQAWVPVWQMLLLGLALAAGMVALRDTLSSAAQPVADLVAVTALEPLSVIPVHTGHAIAAAAAFAVAGFALDGLTRRMGPRLQWSLSALPAILLVLLGTRIRQEADFGSQLLRQDPLFPLRVALVAPDPGTRVRLGLRTTAWLLRTASTKLRGTAILLHGNHPLASAQPAAVSLQGALMRAGYDVLSVDHPGYGASGVPDASADWSAWDPSIGARQAFAYLASQNDSRAPATIVVGHSVGVDVALKFVADGARVQDAYLFAGSLDHPDAQWIRLFYEQHKVPCCLPLPTIHMIRDQFYGGADRFAAALPDGHALVHFVRMGIDYWDVVRDRDALYAAIAPPKSACNFAAVTHYLNALSVWRLALIDTGAIRRTSDIFVPGERVDADCRHAANG
jgi:hypothetical protein